MRGSVALQKNDSVWALLGVIQKYRAEIVRGDERFTIRWTQKFGSKNTHYELLSSGELLQRHTLLFDGAVYRMDLSFRGTQFLEYQLDTSGRGLFRTSEGEISTAIKVPGNKRRYLIGEMRFGHADYQSSMGFECPPDQFHQAAFVANLLFNPPLLNQEG